MHFFLQNLLNHDEILPTRPFKESDVEEDEYKAGLGNGLKNSSVTIFFILQNLFAEVVDDDDYSLEDLDDYFKGSDEAREHISVDFGDLF